MPSASMRELFTFADKLDMLLFVIGAVAALGTGTLQVDSSRLSCVDFLCFVAGRPLRVTAQ